MKAGAVVAGALIVGGGYAIFKCFKGKKGTGDETRRMEKTQGMSASVKRSTGNCPPDAASAKIDLEATRKEVSGNISERHQETEKIIRQSVANVFEEGEEQQRETKNDSKIDDLLNDLNDM